MSKKELKQIIRQNKGEVNKEPSILPEDNQSQILDLKLIKDVLISPVSGMSTSRLLDKIEDIQTYIVQLQEMVRLFRRISWMEDHGDGREITPEDTIKYNKMMGYSENTPNPLFRPGNITPKDNGENLDGFTQEELQALLAPPDADSAAIRLTDALRLNWENNNDSDEAVITAITLGHFELEALHSMLEHSGIEIETGPTTNEREIITQIICRNPTILERWLHRDTRHE